jgi:pimeloyl-ACP methyl ester carboxylesterase
MMKIRNVWNLAIWMVAGVACLQFQAAEPKPAVTTKSPPPQKALPLPGEVLSVAGHTAFVIVPTTASSDRSTPWVLYAPTLPGLPGPEEKWMFERFLEAGIAVAGIDVGESYGNAAGRVAYSALHEALTTRRRFARKVLLLGRSRGGLMTLSWAAENPEKVAGFAGIYPVCNLASYPGITNAAPAFGLTPAELTAQLSRHNPIDRLEPLARAKVPLFVIHGDQDKLVPLEANSGLVRSRYQALGGSMEWVVPAGQGHNMWTGFFQSQELVAFILREARNLRD